MRITRAAKVAAFPLTALILVALIACQGPAGPAGADGSKGDPGAAGAPGADGAQGPPGMDAPHPLASVVIDTVYFSLPQAAGTDDDPVPEVEVDVSTGFTGGTAEGRTYKLGAVANSGQFTGFSYDLDESTLKLTMGEQPAPTDTIEDITIPIQATDTNGAVATTTVIVRGNVVPVVASATTNIELIVGLQAAPTADGTDEDMDPDDYDGQSVTDGDITCVMLNQCTVDLTGVTDLNRDDSHVWRFHNTDEDSVMVQSTDKGVMITGLKAADAAVSVYVWAEDAGGMPMLAEEDDETTTDVDETKWPGDAAREIQVTIDPPPDLGEGLTINGQMVTLPAQTLKSANDTRVLGTVFDDETVVLTPTGGSHPRIVSIALDSTDTTFTDGVIIQATPQNLTASRRTFTFTLTEADQTNGPAQLLEVSVDITVSND